MIEVEAKFLVHDLAPIRARIEELGGRLISARHFERNWRFDRMDGSLSERRAVLRVRQDAGTHLTYKERHRSIEERREIEVGVTDPNRMMDILHALGYEVIGFYEKHREQFAIGDCRVMLDQLPFGEFAEVEAPDLASLQSQVEKLGMRWDLRAQHTYLELFNRLAKRLDLSTRELTFKQFAELAPIGAELLGLEYAAPIAESAS